MPSSVVFAALVLAWLVVLVPVIARRRQMVPRPAEADLCARVLPRSVGAPVMEEVPVAETHSDANNLAGERSGATTAVIERPDETPDAVDAELSLDARDDDDLVEDVDDTERGSRERLLARPVHDDDLADDPDDGYESYDGYDADGGYDSYDPDGSYDSYDDFYEDEDLPPRSYRPGRGGFDPDAAAVAAHLRYAYRQRVALGLIAVAVLSALAALVVSSTIWWLHVVADLVLVGYLVFLRRQTRIEEEVRVRRAARLSGERRALQARHDRQAEHEARMAAVSGWGDDEAVTDDERWDDQYEDDDRWEDEPLEEAPEAPRWIAPRTPAPPVPADLELVDDSDDDPAFHDLEGERMPHYQRVAGA